jgi:hypothetical protein
MGQVYPAVLEAIYMGNAPYILDTRGGEAASSKPRPAWAIEALESPSMPVVREQGLKT